MIRQTVGAALLCLAALGVHAEVVNVDSAELARLAASGVAVIDIRTEPEWKESGVIAGSRLLTYVDEKGRVDQPAWLEKVKSVAPGQPVILICRSGNRTRAATQFLAQQAGYQTVYNAAGGMNAWLKEGRSVVPPSGAVTTGCAAGGRC